jgi:hypothetical protein
MDWVKRSSPLSNEEILQLEVQLGVKLPQDFVIWFKQFEDLKSSEVWVNVNGDPYDVTEFYAPQKIVSKTASFFNEDEDLKTNGTAVPFAFTSILDQYCFFYPKGSKRPSGIFLRPRDDEISEIFEGTDIKSELYISPTFQGFLDKLYIREIG